MIRQVLKKRETSATTVIYRSLIAEQQPATICFKVIYVLIAYLSILDRPQKASSTQNKELWSNLSSAILGNVIFFFIGIYGISVKISMLSVLNMIYDVLHVLLSKNLLFWVYCLKYSIVFLIFTLFSSKLIYTDCFAFSYYFDPTEAER